MSANYIRFLEEGLGYVKKYQGFISVDTKMAIVEGVIDFILTGDYPFYSFAPKITLSSTSKIFSKENVENITLPSEERKIRMYPVDFEEFMIYMGEELLFEYIKKK